jgi:RNase adaptor protein for sRNA GlmZ degradation
MTKLTDIILTALVLIFAFLYFAKSCESKPIQPIENIEQLKDSIRVLKSQKQISKDSIVYKDSIRTKIVTRWKEVRHDSLIPCEEKLSICDTIIRADSSLIGELKANLAISDLIIFNQDLIIKSDSVTIAGLYKQVKKERRKKRLWQAISAGLAGVVVTRL